MSSKSLQCQQLITSAEFPFKSANELVKRKVHFVLKSSRVNKVHETPFLFESFVAINLGLSVLRKLPVSENYWVQYNLSSIWVVSRVNYTPGSRYLSKKWMKAAESPAVWHTHCSSDSIKVANSDRQQRQKNKKAWNWNCSILNSKCTSRL